MTTNTKCYNCVLDPNTCLYRCGLSEEDCDYLMHNKGVSQELAILAARATKLALQNAIDDLTDFLELGITEADDVYNRHCTYLHNDPVDPNAPY